MFLMNNLKKNTPKISIILPVYNAGKYLSLAIESILNQSFSDFEIIAINDGSKDNSLKILKEYAFKDNRIKVYSNKKNLGVSKSANKAIKFTSGQFIARMDADDIMIQNRLKNQYEFLISNPKHILIGGQVILTDPNSKIIGEKKFPLDHRQIKEMLFTAMPVQQATTMINRGLLSRNFIWYEDGMNTAEEVELFFKLLQYGKFANLDSFVHEYRQHSDSLSRRNPKDTFRLTYIARKKGVRLHGYIPSAKASVISSMQKLIITILPKNLIYPIYYSLRKLMILISSSSIKKNQSSTIPKLYTSFNIHNIK